MADSDIRERKYLYFMKNNKEQMSAYNFLEKLGRSHLCMPFITRLILEFIKEYSKQSIDSISNIDAQQLVKIYLSNIIEPSKLCEKNVPLSDNNNILDFLTLLVQASIKQGALGEPYKEEDKKTNGRFQKNNKISTYKSIVTNHDDNSVAPDDELFDDDIDINPNSEKIAEMKNAMNAFGL